MGRRADALAKALYDAELLADVNDGDRKLKVVGIFSKNNAQWVTIDIACMLGDITSVTLYDTLGEQATEFIIN